MLFLTRSTGPIVRISPSSLSFNMLEAFQAVQVDRNANVGRDEWYKSLDISSGAYSTQSCMDKQEHLFRRRVLSQAFSERALRDSEGFIRSNVQMFCDRVGKGAEKPGQWTPKVNLGNEATYFGFDFISDLTFGRAYGLMVKEEPRYIPSVLMWTSQFLYAVDTPLFSLPDTKFFSVFTPIS
jgi:cytochrome P450